MDDSKPNTLTRYTFAVWCFALAIVLIGRIIGPSDLGQNLDQSKTIAFTLDMVEHGHWILPRDGLGELTRKPPMVNWVGVPIVAMGFHNELALKLPAVLSGITITILIFFAARFLFRRLDTDPADPADPADRSIAAHATPLGMLAAGAWLASPSAIKHIYFMRPDILFAALLCTGWFASVVLLTNDKLVHPKRLALLIWLLTASAALTKGPLAALIPLYLLLHILVLIPRGQRKAAIAKIGWLWGIPLMLLLPSAWLLGAYRINPEHVTDALFGTELGDRLGNGGAGGFISALIHNPAFFFERFLPWCLPALLAMLFKPSAAIRSHPIAPATLWVLLVLTFTTVLSLQAGSYIMPAYPAAAILAVYALYRIIATTRATRSTPAIIAIGILVILSAALITTREATMSRGARTGSGEHIKDFAHKASDLVGTDSVRFEQLGDCPIPSLMGRHQPGDIEPHPAFDWLIEPIEPIAADALRQPILISEPIVVHDPATGEPIDHSIRLGLYPSADD
ncbi:MAG: ArnT family glycosyltransferase [Phycisphaerales bacterium]